MKHLWLVEDDPEDFEVLIPLFEKELGLSVSHIATEKAFRDQYGMLAVTHPPAVVIIDQCLGWTKPGNYVDAPIEIKREETKGGLRCRALLRSYPLTRPTPVVFYSWMPGSCFPEDDKFMRKSQPENLVRFVQYLLMRGEMAYVT